MGRHSLESVSALIKSIPSKKNDLRKAFEDLQAHSSSLASFTLQWKDLEEHFDSIEKSIQASFKELEARDSLCSQSPSPVKETARGKNPIFLSTSVEKMETKQENVVKEPDFPFWPELKALCVKMDSKGLRQYIINNRKDLPSVREAIPLALRFAKDPAKLVLDAMDGFYRPNSKGDKDSDLASIRRTCILLLEKLSSLSLDIKSPLKDRAKKLGLEWKGKITPGGQNPLEIICFLQLIATFGLFSSFDIDQVVDPIVDVARRKQTIELCRVLLPADKIPYLIQKMINKGKQIDAVNFAYSFEVVNKFPPVSLLNDYLVESKNVSQEIRRKGNNSTMSQHEAIARETAAIRAVLKITEEHKLEAEFSREILEKQIAELESQKPEKKRPAPFTAAASKHQQQQPKKRPRPAVTSSVASVSHTSSFLNPDQPPSLIVDRVPSYMVEASAGPYGLVRSTGAHYGHLSSGAGILGPLSPPRAHLYTSQPLLLSRGASGGLYERAVPHGYTSGSGLQSLQSYRSSMYQ
ncbi:truncated FRIGIDA-like protein 1 [Aristolochia californica]|uniref:truncated FRIGIDA-like protein 1 n=1 Tax=Aristolochia californica TaxID=171875 RepID=UPI0035E01BEF